MHPRRHINIRIDGRSVRPNRRDERARSERASERESERERERTRKREREREKERERAYETAQCHTPSCKHTHLPPLCAKLRCLRGGTFLGRSAHTGRTLPTEHACAKRRERVFGCAPFIIARGVLARVSQQPQSNDN